MVIARRWSARAAGPAQADAYVAHFETAVRPQLERTDGFVRATVERADGEAGVEIVVVTVWQSLEAVRAFAGPDLDRAVVEPDAQAVLSEFDTRVEHRELADAQP